MVQTFGKVNAGGVTISGGLEVYRGCNSVWTFFVRNAKIKETGSSYELGREPRTAVADMLKVVLVDSTQPGQ